jgi:prolipoprotein diacylglyceryltransferase
MGFNLAFKVLITPWSRVLPEKLTGSQLVKKFPVFYGTGRFITAFTRARHLPLT